jgi:hypothetical protein
MDIIWHFWLKGWTGLVCYRFKLCCFGSLFCGQCIVYNTCNIIFLLISFFSGLTVTLSQNCTNACSRYDSWREIH